jgi:polyribonucleotide nucleotidyltransferase
MVESGAFELSEEMLVEALTIAQTEIDRLCDLQIELIKRVGKPKMEAPVSAIPADVSAKVNEWARGRFKEAVRTAEKGARETLVAAIHKDVKEKRPRSSPTAWPAWAVSWTPLNTKKRAA